MRQVSTTKATTELVIGLNVRPNQLQSLIFGLNVRSSNEPSRLHCSGSEDASKSERNLYRSFRTENILLSENEEEKWKLCRTLTPVFLGSMFDAMALSPVFTFEH